MKSFILSQPKSGTYLCANLLEEFKMYNTYMHFSNNGKSWKKFSRDPDHGLLLAKKLDKAEFTRSMDFKQGLGLIPENSFAVGHISRTDVNYVALRKFKKILIYRPQIEVIQSMERFNNDNPERLTEGGLRRILRLHENMHTWHGEPGTFTLTFKDMLNINVPVIDKLQHFLFGNIPYDSERCMKRAMEKDSITKSKMRGGI